MILSEHTPIPSGDLSFGFYNEPKRVMGKSITMDICSYTCMASMYVCTLPHSESLELEEEILAAVESVLENYHG